MQPPLSFAQRWSGGYANSAQPRPADPARLQQLAGQTMGTTWSLRFDNPQLLPLDAVRAQVTSALDGVIAQMSHWEPDSDLSRFNRAPAGSRHVLPPEFAQVLGCALHWAERSGGAIDPALGPLVALWGFGPHATAAPRWPPPAQIADARTLCGWQRVDFDSSRHELLQPGGLSLDFSGIAKGFAVDQVAAQLQALGLRDLLIEVGGELRGLGQRPDGQPWRVQIAALEGEREAAPTIALQNLAIASSGDRWHRHQLADGRQWSHTLDPRTGMPVDDRVASVSVLHAECMQADALATVLLVLGAAAGPAFAEQQGLAARWVLRNGERLHSRASSFWPTA